MLQNLTGWHALIILAVVVLIFGAAKLPALAKSVGQSMRILKNETRDDSAETPASHGDASALVDAVQTTATERLASPSTAGPASA